MNPEARNLVRRRRSPRRPTAVLALGAAVAAIIVPGGQAASSAGGTGQAGEYIPFVTDFPHVERAPADRYVPFVTDFPTPASEPVAAADGGGSAVEWRDIGVAGTGAAALALILGASVLGMSRHARPAGS